MRIAGDNEKLQKFAAEVKEFEERLYEKHRRLMQEEMRTFLEHKEREAVETLQDLGRYESKGFVSRTILTSVGKVHLRVHRYRARKRGRWCYPLRDLYGVEGITPCARALYVAVAIERSYAWSAEALAQLRGMEISRMRLWQVVQDEGARLRAELEAERQKIFDQARGRREESDRRSAVIEVDGTMLVSRESTAEADLRGRKRMEVKVGVVFRGVAGVGRHRRATCERSVYACVADVDTFSEQFSAHCTVHGVGADTPVHFLGDGATWIQSVRHAVFPHSRYTLDLYHLQKAAHRVMLPRQSEKFCILIKTGLVQTALAYVRELRPVDAAHAEELRTFIEYLQDNRAGMYYRTGDLHGSGVIEKMVDLVVKKRMKRQGMRWSQRGANAMLILRSSYLNENHHHRYQTVRPIAHSPHCF
jgi:hypothetical protein